MTKVEFDSWTKMTKFSEKAWVLDENTLHNYGEYLFYKGGENGVYIEVRKDGIASVGEYEGAIPHIGEAFFIVKHENKIASNREGALTKIIERLGLPFLMDLLKCRS